MPSVNTSFDLSWLESFNEGRNIRKIVARQDTSPKAGKSKYGDVTFADSKNNKYPIDSEAHVRAAWSYINMPKNAGKYSAADLSTIKGRIRSAAKKFNIAINTED